MTQRPLSSTRVPADIERRFGDHDVEMDRHRHGAADAGAGTKRDVDGAEDLLVLEHVAGERGAVVGADAELGEVGPGLAVDPQPLEVLGTDPALGLDEPPARDRQRYRRVAQTERRQARATTVPSPPSGAMNASPQGRLPNAPFAVRSPSSAIPARPRQTRA